MSTHKPAREAGAAHSRRATCLETSMEEESALAKADCLKLATSVYTTMPREVRDQVYSHLFLPDPHLPQKLFKPEQMLDSRVVHTDMPHWQSQSFVGPDFAREYTEFFYTNTELHFDPIPTPAIFPITNILEHDPFGTGILPSDFIRSCYIDFTERDFDYTTNADAIALKSQINCLLTLKPHPKRRIIFRINLGGANAKYEHDCYDVMFKHILFLGLLLYNFKDKGLAFSVLLSTDLAEPREQWRDVTFLWDMESTQLFHKLHEWALAEEVAKPHVLWNGNYNPYIRYQIFEEEELAKMRWMLWNYVESEEEDDDDD